MTQDRIAFGIGCFHFSPAAASAKKGLTWTQHFQNVATALTEIGATDVECTYEQEPKYDSVPQLVRTPSLSRGEAITPEWGIVSFNIRVPATFQRAEEPMREPTGETYGVEIRYTYFLPVAYVVTEDPGDQNPSTGVRLVRRYLDERLKDAEKISFQILGPSPFHTDCHLEPRPPSDPPDPALTLARNPRSGYDRLTFSYDPSAHNLVAAYELLVRSTEGELGFSYHLDFLDSRRNQAWGQIDELTSLLVELASESGIRGYARRLWKIGRVTSDASIALSAFDADAVMEQTSVNTSFDETYGGDTPGFFRPYVEDNLRHRFTFPSEQTDRLVSRFETRRARSYENLALMLGPLFGVMVGAAIAWLIAG
jgi:hypothetical protein